MITGMYCRAGDGSQPERLFAWGACSSDAVSHAACCQRAKRPVVNYMCMYMITSPFCFFKMAPKIVIRDVFSREPHAPTGAGCEIRLESRFDHTKKKSPTFHMIGVSGRVINVTSQHGMVCCPQDIAYGVSKAASQSQIINKNGATYRFEMCFAPDQNMSRIEINKMTKTCLESVNKEV